MTAKPSQCGNDDSDVLKFKDFQGPLTSNSKTFKAVVHFQGLSRSWKNEKKFQGLSRTFKAMWPPCSWLPLAGLNDGYLLRSCATTSSMNCFQKSNSSTFKDVQTKIQGLSRTTSVFKDFQGLENLQKKSRTFKDRQET